MPTPFDDAQEALRVADVDPRRATVLADRAAVRARQNRDVRALSVARRAQGLAAIHRGDLEAASAVLRTAVRLGVAAGDPAIEGAARMTLAAALSQGGRFRDALREIQGALRLLTGPEAATALAQRGMVLACMGRLQDALADLDQALPAVRRAGDDVGAVTLLVNRGAVHLERFELAAAHTDLDAAIALGGGLGLDLMTGFAHANLGYTLVLRGDIPAALAHFDQGEATLRTHASQLGRLLSMRAELLLSVRLLREAREAAAACLAAYRRDRLRSLIPDAHLLIAQIAAAEGDHDAAREHARRAVRGFARQDRPQLATLGRLVLLRAQDLDPAAPAPPRDRVADLARQVSAAGWPAATVEAHLLAARAGIRRGSADDGEDHLQAAARYRSRQVPATVRARAWYAEALRREQHGHRAAARRAARDGLRVLEDNAAVLGATDLRAHAAGHRTDLARLGLRLALADRDPRAALVWADRGRATQLLGPRVRPHRDPDLAAMLSTLRTVVGEVDERRRAGEHATRATARQVSLERAIRDRTRLLESGSTDAGPGDDPGTGRPDAVTAARWSAALGDRGLVEYALVDGRLLALTLVGGRCRTTDLGPQGMLDDLLARVPFALHRLARGAVRPANVIAAVDLLQDAAVRLDTLLFAALRQLHGRDLVIVPTGPLQGMPWSILPGLRGRVVTVSPSAALWETAATAPNRPGHVLVAAGPHLLGAVDEAVRVAAIHGVSALVPPDATTAAVSAALDGAALVHLATHGRLSTDNPLFSQLLLSDGPLLVYDLEQLESKPHTVVLASCESGRNAVRAGDELLGFTATLLAGGSAQLVASVVPVPDAQTTPLMTALHTCLAAGRSLAESLATAQSQLADDGPAAMAAAAGFVCLGAGFLPARPARSVSRESTLRL